MMKIVLRIFLMAVILLSTVYSAVAAVDVTYRFDQTDVQAQVFACQDESCSQVTPFAGSFEQSVSDGLLTVTYPTQLQTPYGYAVYFVSDGFIPKESVSTLWGTGTIVRDDTLVFSQVSDCKTTIDHFQVIDVSQPHLPITVQANAALDAVTYSAFNSQDTGVEYVPPQFLSDHYSADTLVTLTIYGPDGSVVDTQSRQLSIPVDQAAPVEFSWTPTLEGEHTAKIEVVIVDNQCSSYGAPQSSTKQFTVLEELPMNACYTLVNQLSPDKLHYKVGDLVQMMYNKISNHANDEDPHGPDYVLAPQQTQVDYKVYAPGGDLVVDTTQTLPANTLATVAEWFGFDFFANTAGTYTVEVAGRAAGALCAGLENVGDVIQTTFFVEEDGVGNPEDPQTFEVDFLVQDTGGNPLSGAQVVLHGAIGFTGAQGGLVFEGLTEGSYSYSVSKSGYVPYTGQVLVEADAHVTVTLSSSSSGPQSHTGSGSQDAEEQVPRKGLHVGAIRIPSAFKVEPGAQLPVYLYFTNDGDVDLEDLRATVVLQELPARRSIGPFDLDDGDSVTKVVYVDLPDAPLFDVYPVRVTLEGDGVKRVIYREIEIPLAQKQQNI